MNRLFVHLKFRKKSVPEIKVIAVINAERIGREWVVCLKFGPNKSVERGYSANFKYYSQHFRFIGTRLFNIPSCDNLKIMQSITNRVFTSGV
jgi:hypothetical protein